MAAMNETMLPVSSLLLDPNNYRFQDDPNFVAADNSRFHEETVQERAMKRLRDENLKSLKDSIVANGFLPIERLVVRVYSEESGLYLVLEGNRRLAALRWIQEDYEAGVHLPAAVVETLEAVPVVLLTSDADPSFYESMMGVRHVSGIRPWAGYQRAKLIARLRDHFALDTSEVAQRLAMTSQEVNRRYRAFKALEQMQNDEEFGEYAKPSMYPFFHEAVTWRPIREWLRWVETEYRFDDHEQLHTFYRLITPEEMDDGETRPPKISTREQVRDLKDILPNAEARRLLFDPTKTFIDAISVAKHEQLSKAWMTQVAEAITALSTVSMSQVKALGPDDMAEIERLVKTASTFLDDYKKLRGE